MRRRVILYHLQSLMSWRGSYPNRSILGTSVVAANLRVFCTVFEKVSPMACSLRYCGISGFSRPSSNLVLSATSFCSGPAFGQATLYSDLNSTTDSVASCRLCSNFRMASLALSTSPKRRDKASQNVL